nr:hypothetical protein Iba_scaffold61835CG0010 [Ipomoea batatas]
MNPREDYCQFLENQWDLVKALSAEVAEVAEIQKTQSQHDLERDQSKEHSRNADRKIGKILRSNAQHNMEPVLFSCHSRKEQTNNDGKWEFCKE